MADEKSLEKKSTKKKQAKPKPTKTKAEPVKQVEELEELEAEETQTISLFLAVGLIIGALVVGLVIGYVAAPKNSTSNDFVVPGSANAPALTPEQLKGGQLPAGHPQVPGLGAPEASTQTTAAPEAQTQPEQKETKSKTKK